MEGVKSRVSSFLPKFINLPAASILVEGLKSQVNSFLKRTWMNVTCLGLTIPRLPVMRRASMLEDAREKEKRTWMNVTCLGLTIPDSLWWDVHPCSKMQGRKRREHEWHAMGAAATHVLPSFCTQLRRQARFRLNQLNPGSRKCTTSVQHHSQGMGHKQPQHHDQGTLHCGWPSASKQFVLQRLPGPCPHETSRFKPSRTFRGPNATATRTIPRKTIWSWFKSYWKDLFISTVPNVPRQLQPVSRTSQKFPGNNLRTSRKTVRNPPEPCRELHRNLSETLQNLPGNCTGTCPKPIGTTYCARINSWFKSSWKELFKPSRTTLRAARKTHRNLAGNCTGTCLKPSGTFLGTVQEPTVGELTLDLSPPERNFSNRPEPPFELPAKPTGTLPATAREPVWNLPEPSWELHKNLPET